MTVRKEDIKPIIAPAFNREEAITGFLKMLEAFIDSALRMGKRDIGWEDLPQPNPKIKLTYNESKDLTTELLERYKLAGWTIELDHDKIPGENLRTIWRFH